MFRSIYKTSSGRLRERAMPWKPEPQLVNISTAFSSSLVTLSTQTLYAASSLLFLTYLALRKWTENHLCNWLSRGLYESHNGKRTDISTDDAFSVLFPRLVPRDPLSRNVLSRGRQGNLVRLCMYQALQRERGERRRSIRGRQQGTKWYSIQRIGISGVYISSSVSFSWRSWL